MAIRLPFDVGAVPGCLDLARGGALDRSDELASACPLHDLAVGVGDFLPVEPLGTPCTLERLSTTTQGLWMFAPPPTTVIAVNLTVEKR
jgi:hypothetical protein